MLNFFKVMLNDQSYKKMLLSSNDHNVRRAQTKILVYSIFWGFGSHLADEA